LDAERFPAAARERLNDLFTRVVELARANGLGRLATCHRTRRASRRTLRGIASTLSPRCATRGRAFGGTFVRWQKQCDAEDPNEGAGQRSGREVIARLEQQLEENSRTPGAAAESGPEKLSRSDPDSRFLRERGGSRWATRPRWPVMRIT